jgi:hypothetical protein
MEMTDSQPFKPCPHFCNPLQGSVTVRFRSQILFIGFVLFSEQTTIIFLNRIENFSFVMEVCCVFFELRTQFYVLLRDVPGFRSVKRTVFIKLPECNKTLKSLLGSRKIVLKITPLSLWFCFIPVATDVS